MYRRSNKSNSYGQGLDLMVDVIDNSVRNFFYNRIRHTVKAIGLQTHIARIIHVINNDVATLMIDGDLCTEKI